MKQTETLNIPPVLQSKLEEFRNRLWSVKIGEGALAGIAGLIASFLIVLLVDRAFNTPIWLRVSLLIFGFAIPAVGIPFRYHKWVWRKRSLGAIARVLRKRYPRIGDELLGIVDLARERQTMGYSQALVEAAMNQVANKVKDQDFSDAIPENHYRKWSYISLGLGALAFVAIALISPAAHSSLARWMTPWRMIERFTFAKLEPIQNQMIVPFAEPFDLAPQLRPSTEWQPEFATIRLPGKTRLRSEISEQELYRFSVPPQKENASLTLRVGDAVEAIQIKPLPRPELSNLSAKIRLPDYLRYQKDPIFPIRGGTVDVLVGSSASFIGNTSRELVKASANGIPAAISGSSFSTMPEDIKESKTQLFEWQDNVGLTAKNPFELRINAITDAPPNVFAKKLSFEDVILPNEVVTFEVNSTDDYGLREVGLEWTGIRDPIHNQESAVGSKIIATGGPEFREIETQGTFSAKRSAVKPQTIQLRAYSEDYLPNRKRVYSPVFLLHILEPSDHANWLTGEFGKWFSRAREVYEKEQQLHESNQELRKLSADELDRPENRKKLESQAASESNNARRLEALTTNGRDLVRQAAKNDEFEAKRLETWAEMMRSLEDISKNKMPSVADLLKKAAQAEGGKKSDSTLKEEKSEEKPPDGKSSPAAPSVSNQNQDPNSVPAKPQDQKKDDNSPPKNPSLSDNESTFNKPKPGEEQPPEQPKPTGPGRLELPTTTLQGEAEAKLKDASAYAETATQTKLEDALKEQKELLAEFAKVTDELQLILSSLETSTFVKRLKSASRRQLEVAKDLNQTVTGGFGVSKERIATKLQETIVDISKTEAEESDRLYTIQSDLDAYYQRKQDTIFKNVLEQMKKSSVITQLKKLGAETSENLNGRSIAAAEFWSDTLDRWAEELVAAGNQSDPNKESGDSKDKLSLPPEIVLEVMKIARSQMDLREETREVGNIKSSLSPVDYKEKTQPLEISQSKLHDRLDEVVLDLKDLPEAEENFGREIKLLNHVSDVMRQARGVLARPDTGPEVIAAQTEAIELLLQTQRQPPNNGGGGGGNSPGGGGSGNNGGSLSDINVAPGGTSQPSSPTKRDVDQSTGKTGQEFPEEFRNGLDTYFNELEKIR